MPKIFFKDFEEKIAELGLHVTTIIFNAFSRYLCLLYRWISWSSSTGERKEWFNQFSRNSGPWKEQVNFHPIIPFVVSMLHLPVDFQAVNAFVVGVPWILYSKQGKNTRWESKTEAESLLLVRGDILKGSYLGITFS